MIFGLILREKRTNCFCGFNGIAFLFKQDKCLKIIPSPFFEIKAEIGNGISVTIAGIIENARQVVTRNDERMAFLKIADLTDSIEAVCFPSIFKANIDILVAEKCIALSGKVSLRNGEKSIIIEAVKEV